MYVQQTKDANRFSMSDNRRRAVLALKAKRLEIAREIADEIGVRLVGSEMCIRDRPRSMSFVSAQDTMLTSRSMQFVCVKRA